MEAKNCDVTKLKFARTEITIPAFFGEYFSLSDVKATNNRYERLGNVGEVWINGSYIGAFWVEESQRSMLARASVLKLGKKHMIVLDLKNNGTKTTRRTDKPVFN